MIDIKSIYLTYNTFCVKMQVLEVKIMKKINLAFEFAAKKHEGQKRKNLNVPYFVHLYEVFQILREFTDDETTLLGGILHDTLEDTQTSFQELEQNFGYEVAKIVKFCSEKDKNLPYMQRKMEHAFRMMNAPLRAKLVKCADDISNWKTTLLDLKNGENAWEKFNADKDTVKFNYALSAASFADLREKYPKMYQTIIGLFNDLFDEHLQNLTFDEAFRFLPQQTENKNEKTAEKKTENGAERKTEKKKILDDGNFQGKRRDAKSIIKTKHNCFRLGSQEIFDCRQCPYSAETLDPSPDDWFRDDDTKVDCQQLNRNIVRHLEGFHEFVPIPEDCPFVKEENHAKNQTREFV